MEELLKRATIIRDESIDNENTAERVGTLFVDVIQQMQKIVSDEQVKVESLKFIATVDSLKIYFDVVDESGNIIHKKLTLPVVSDVKAGILTSAQLNDINKRISEITPRLITESKFNELKDAGKLDPTKFYYTYDEES